MKRTEQNTLKKRPRKKNLLRKKEPVYNHPREDQDFHLFKVKSCYKLCKKSFTFQLLKKGE